MNFLTGTNGQLHYKSILIITLSAISLIASTPNIGFSDWTWVSGSNTRNQPGVYGTKGVADPANIPGSRWYSISWTDGSGSLWLFGGEGYYSTGNKGLLNDLWKFDGTNWTWVSGSNIKDQRGVYGTKGVADPANVPGAREWSVSWTDGGGNLWLFGGYGYGSTASTGALNDLWKFDGENWTWVSGSDIVGQPGVYGTKGVADPANIPGARAYSVSWIDGGGNLWLFGGQVIYGNNNSGYGNDLWKFDGENWTWVSGSNIKEQWGIYGTKGVADPANIPGARGYSVSWTDGSGSLWLFGGYGINSTGGLGYLNDLWKFDGTSWTWVSGSNIVFQSGVYGTKGEADPLNMPGGRYYSVSWIDGSGSLWLFGGHGLDSTGSTNRLNDLWKFDGTSWTWVSGSDTINKPGVYGTKGEANPANVPGARVGSISWTDGVGSLWLFGGSGYDSTGSEGLLSDLWKFDAFPSYHPADTNSDYVIDMLEILSYIDKWAVGDVGMLEVLEAIDLWAAGSYYWDPVDEKFKPGEP